MFNKKILKNDLVIIKEIYHFEKSKKEVIKRATVRKLLFNLFFSKYKSVYIRLC